MLANFFWNFYLAARCVHQNFVDFHQVERPIARIAHRQSLGSSSHSQDCIVVELDCAATVHMWDKDIELRRLQKTALDEVNLAVG